MKTHLSIAEDKVFEERFSVLLSEIEYEHIRPKQTEPEDPNDVFLNGGYDPLSGATIYVERSGRDHINDILCGRPRSTGDEISDYMSLNAKIERSVTSSDIVELYDTFGKIEFAYVNDVVLVFNLLNDWITQIKRSLITSIGYQGLSDEDSLKLQTFVDAITTRANNINIRNLGEFSTLDGAWTGIERHMLRNNLVVHDPTYLANTFGEEFRRNDTRGKVLTKGRIVVPKRVTEELTNVDRLPGVYE